MKTERKHVEAAIKQAGEGGSFEAVIATFGVVDRDGDIVEPGAFGGATVSVLPAHDARHVPLGKAQIEERGDKAVAVGRFNLDIQAAADWHSALKFDLDNIAPPVQEWSWDFRPIEATKDTIDGDPVRRLKIVDTKEVSPVLRGASMGSGTIAVKRLKAEGRSDNDRRELLERALGEKEGDAEWLWVDAVFDDVVVYTLRREGEPAKLFERDFELAEGADAPELGDDRRDVVREQSFRVVAKGDDAPPVKLADELRWVSGDVAGVVKRVLEVAERRKAEGRPVGEPVSKGAIDLAEHCAELDALMKSLRDVAVEVMPNDEIAQAAARFLRSEARLRGV